MTRPSVVHFSTRCSYATSRRRLCRRARPVLPTPSTSIAHHGVTCLGAADRFSRSNSSSSNTWFSTYPDAFLAITMGSPGRFSTFLRREM